MSKLIFILFLFFCSLQSFSQKNLLRSKINTTEFSNKTNALEKEKIETVKFQELLKNGNSITFKDPLCDVLTIKVSDLLIESMLKKLLANV
jgi:hypothetical protein